MGEDVVDFEFADTETAERAAAALGADAKVLGHEIRINASDGPATLAAAMESLRQAGLEATGVSLSQPTLDDVFLNLTDGAADAGR